MRRSHWVWVAAGLGIVTMTALTLALLLRPALLQPSRWSPEGRQIGIGTPAIPSSPASIVDRLLVLVMGVDERGDDVGRADTLLVASVDLAHRRVALLSIPRDMYVEIPDFGFDKINHAYAYGGEELMLRTVRGFLGLPVEHFAVVNFDGFRAVVDALGGVEVEILEPMHYEDPYDDLIIDFQAGSQTLDGELALNYARYRADADGDNGRIQRQQKLIKLIGAKALRPQTGLRLPAFVSSLAGAVRTDVPISRLLALAAQGRELTGARPESDVITGEDRYIGNVYYMVPDISAARSKAYGLLLGMNVPDALRVDAAHRQRSVEHTLLAEENVASEAAERMAAAAPEPPAPDPAPPLPQTEPSPAGQGESSQMNSESQAASEDADSGKSSEPVSAPKLTVSNPLPLPAITLVDSSGRQLAARYSLALRQRGYQIVEVRRGETVAGTTIIDNSGRPEIVQDLLRVAPGAAVRTVPVQGAGGAGSVTIVIGADSP